MNLEFVRAEHVVPGPVGAQIFEAELAPSRPEPEIENSSMASAGAANFPSVDNVELAGSPQSFEVGKLISGEVILIANFPSAVAEIAGSR